MPHPASPTVACSMTTRPKGSQRRPLRLVHVLLVTTTLACGGSGSSKLASIDAEADWDGGGTRTDSRPGNALGGTGGGSPGAGGTAGDGGGTAGGTGGTAGDAGAGDRSPAGDGASVGGNTGTALDGGNAGGGSGGSVGGVSDGSAGAGDATAGSSDGPAGSTADGAANGGVGGASGAGGGSGTDGSGATPPTLDMAGTPACGGTGAPCVSSRGCCAGLCDPTTMTCRAPPPSTCLPSGAACSAATECCTLACINGACGAAACVPDGMACTTGTACCSGTCTAGTCQALATGGCKSAGNPCTDNTQCCSRLCRNGTCALGSSYCIQPGDACARSSDCCTANCVIPSGRTLGTCQKLDIGGAGNCTQDGIVCAGCTNCCSRQCAPYATSGVKICQPASGCRITNGTCQKNSDCCGGDPTAQTEDPGNVTCTIAAGTSPPTGTCRNPTGCQPRGAVCGAKAVENVCGGNEREACCDCPPPKFNCCKADAVGIFRCFGGGSKDCPTGFTGKAPCCIASGERCQFSAECCGGVPCVPDAQGVLRCLPKPPSGPACVMENNACTTTADCCAGLTCNITPGRAFGTCGRPVPPPPPPSPPQQDAGSAPTPDAPIGTPVDAPASGGDTANPPPTDDAGNPLPGDDAGASIDAAEPPPPVDAIVPPLPPDGDPPLCAFFGQSCGNEVTCCEPLRCVLAGKNVLCDDTAPCVCNQLIP